MTSSAKNTPQIQKIGPAAPKITFDVVDGSNIPPPEEPGEREFLAISESNAESSTSESDVNDSEIERMVMARMSTLPETHMKTVLDFRKRATTREIKAQLAREKEERQKAEKGVKGGKRPAQREETHEEFLATVDALLDTGTPLHGNTTRTPQTATPTAQTAAPSPRAVKPGAKRGRRKKEEVESDVVVVCAKKKKTPRKKVVFSADSPGVEELHDNATISSLQANNKSMASKIRSLESKVEEYKKKNEALKDEIASMKAQFGLLDFEEVEVNRNLIDTYDTGSDGDDELGDDDANVDVVDDDEENNRNVKVAITEAPAKKLTKVQLNRAKRKVRAAERTESSTIERAAAKVRKSHEARMQEQCEEMRRRTHDTRQEEAREKYLSSGPVTIISPFDPKLKYSYHPQVKHLVVFMNEHLKIPQDVFEGILHIKRQRISEWKKNPPPLVVTRDTSKTMQRLIAIDLTVIIDKWIEDPKRLETDYLTYKFLKNRLLELERWKDDHPSDRTIRRALRRAKIRRYSVKKVLSLTEEHREARLKYCKAELADLDAALSRGETLDQWLSTRTWSDEKWFTAGMGQITAYANNKSGQVTLRKEERRGAKRMAWAMINIDEGLVGKFIWIRGYVTKETYVQVIEKAFVDTDAKVVEKLRFQQDNASTHDIKDVEAYFKKENKVWYEYTGVGNCLFHPARSPDLSPIETLWALLDRLKDMRGLEYTEDNIMLAVERVLYDFKDGVRVLKPEMKEKIQNICRSYVDMLKACVQADGKRFDKELRAIRKARKSEEAQKAKMDQQKDKIVREAI